jgi:hypothetical protein
MNFMLDLMEATKKKRNKRTWWEKDFSNDFGIINKNIYLLP